MSASRRVAIMGIDADVCWYSNIYDRVLYHVAGMYGSEFKRFSEMPELTDAAIASINIIKSDLLKKITDFKPGDEAFYYRSASEYCVIPFPVCETREEQAKVCNAYKTEYLGYMKRVDAKLDLATTFTFQFLIAAIANRPMIFRMCDRQASFDELQLVCTSSRLTPELEMRAISGGPSGSIFQDILELRKLYAQHLLPGKTILVNKFTVIDALKGFEIGRGFDRCVESYWSDHAGATPELVAVDHTKILYYYGAIHSCMMSDTSASYQAYFFDDLESIESTLMECLSKHPGKFAWMFPCRFDFHRYDGKFNAVVSIVGSGRINSNFAIAVAEGFKHGGYPLNLSVHSASYFLIHPDVFIDKLMGVSGAIARGAVPSLFDETRAITSQTRTSQTRTSAHHVARRPHF